MAKENKNYDRGFGGVDEVCDHFIEKNGPQSVVATCVQNLHSVLKSFEQNDEWVTVSMAVIASYLNRQSAKLGTVYFVDDTGKLSHEYVSSKPLREFVTNSTTD